MQVKVLVVDDSRFYRNRLCEILASDQEIKVVGTAENGKEAVEKALSLMPDVITMDIEMPVMDGISAVREIMKKRPTPVLMFSSLTTDGAQATLNALEAGAVDFFMKRLDKLSFKNGQFANEIRSKIITLGRKGTTLFSKRLPAIAKHSYKLDTDGSTSLPARSYIHGSKAHLDDYRILVIGASTGGPIAVQSIMSALPADFPIPILVVQHMPAAFTGPFAHRLDALSKLTIKEAEDGDIPSPGRGYIAPGGKQMYLEHYGPKTVIRVRESSDSELYRPSVDVTYQSVSEVYGNAALAIILTGMGTDGREGAMSLKRRGSSIWAQDEHSSVVFGMPQAVIEAGLADHVYPINDLVNHLALGV